MKATHARTIGVGTAAVLVPLAIAAPYIVSSFILLQLSTGFCLAIAVLGLKLLAGYGRQLSLGHSAFLALGAYSCGVAIRSGAPYPLALAIAATTGFAIGFAIGWPAMRIRGQHFAIATLMMALVVPQVARLTPLAPWTHGASGLSIPRSAVPDAIPSYFIVLAALAVLSILLRLLIGSRAGRAIQAAGENPVAAEVAGINLALTGAITFAISATSAAIAGGLWLLPFRYVGPDTFSITVAIGLFLGVILTGTRLLPTAAFGGLAIVFLPNWAERISRDLTWTVYGVMLIALLYAGVAWSRRQARLRDPADADRLP